MEAKRIAFSVIGEPVAQGSMRAFRTKAGGIVVTHGSGSRLGAWRGQVSVEAARAWGAPPTTCPVSVRIMWWFLPPKRIPKGRSPRYKDVVPDIDKLTRAVLDALTGVVYMNDAQVCQLTCTKAYRADGPEGADIEVAEMLE